MHKTKRLSVAAVIAALALLGAALFGGVADAKKKGGKSKTVTLNGKAKPIPDATQTCVDKDADGFVDCTNNGNEFKNGILASPIKVPKSLDGAKIKDLNTVVTLTHSEPNDVSIFIVGVNGKVLDSIYPFENNLTPFPPGTHFFTAAGKLGPTTFDDQAPLFINDTNSCPNLTTETGPGACVPATDTRGDGGGLEAFSPYAGAFKPRDGTMASLARKLKAGQMFWLIAMDNDPAGECTLPGCSTGDPLDPQADPPDTGTVGWSLKITPKGGGGKGK